jgi:hypothetical protein
MRVTRSGRSTATICAIAPPPSLPTSVALGRSRASMKSSASRPSPGSEKSMSSAIGTECEPSGQSGTMQRKSFDSRGTTLRHNAPFTPSPWMNSSGSPAPSSR